MRRVFYYNYTDEGTGKSISEFFWEVGCERLADVPDLQANTLWIKDRDGNETEILIGLEDCLLIFVHQNGPDDLWTNLAKSYGARIDIVLMSRDTVSPKDFWSTNVHICGYYADKLENNDRVRTFFQNLEYPDWALLMPDPIAIPEALLAYTLAVQYNLDHTYFKGLVGTADAEYKERLPVLNNLLLSKKKTKRFPQCPEQFPSRFYDEAKHDNTGMRFQAFCSAINLLREDI